MTDFVYNAKNFDEAKRLAGNAWRDADGKADGFAREALIALITETLSPLALAHLVYDEMQPKTAKGQLAEPKEQNNGTVSVSSLRSAKGGNGARVALEAIFYIADNRAIDTDAVAGFIADKAGAFKLNPLKAHLAKLKSEAAKTEADAAAKADTASEPKEAMDETETETVEVLDLSALPAVIDGMDEDTLRANADTLNAIIQAALRASERLAALDELRTGTNG